MKTINLTPGVVAAALIVLPAMCQDRPPQDASAPLYQVTVVQRSMKAINYQYRSGPTNIGFQGTVLLPRGKGEGLVESKQGRTDIDAHFENLTTPQAFGLEYMTYVLWAITPDGRPINLGELIANASNKASLHVTTELKAFGLLVTAEPYAAVRQPSDVVVVENRVREDTIGKIEEINVRYDLMPRGHYTWNMTNKLEAQVASAPKVSMKKYEALLELYQAQNAVAIARNAGAAIYATGTFARAEALLNEAQQLNANKHAESSAIVDSAREASQTAEDARQIADRRKNDDQTARLRIADAERATAVAQAAADRARADAEAARSEAEAERTARQQAEKEASLARDRAAQAERIMRTSPANTVVADPGAGSAPRPPEDVAEKRTIELRSLLLAQLSGPFATRDTVWGMIVTVPDNAFSGIALRPIGLQQLRQISEIVAAHPGLRVAVESHSDSSKEGTLALQKAVALRDRLTASGLPSAVVEVRQMSDSRPLGSNNTALGREQNRRTEIVISGDPIGKFPLWDRPYALTSHN